MRNQIQAMCDKYGLMCIHIPQKIHNFLQVSSYWGKKFQQDFKGSMRHSDCINYSLKILGFKHDDILVLIEEINKCCDYASSEKARSPVCIPFYLKEMEKCLKAPAQDEALFKVFSNYIYQLIVDGHQLVMNEDRAIISKSEFLGFAEPLLKNIRLFRCDAHHLNTKDCDKRKLGEIYNELCGKSVLDDPNSKMKFQLELLKRTADVLKTEFELVKEKTNRYFQKSTLSVLPLSNISNISYP